MTAAELLQRLRDQGLTVRRDGEALVVKPRARVTDEQREALIAHKP